MTVQIRTCGYLYTKNDHTHICNKPAKWTHKYEYGCMYKYRCTRHTYAGANGVRLCAACGGEMVKRNKEEGSTVGRSVKCRGCTRRLPVGRRVLALSTGEGQSFFCSRACLNAFAATGAGDSLSPVGTRLDPRQAAEYGKLLYCDVRNVKEPTGYRRTWYVNKEA